jgi:Holliday junction DNA helicase RuvB
VPELEDIVKRTASIFDTTIVESGAHEFGRRSRGTPRIANRLFKRIRDFAQVAEKPAIDREIVDYALQLLHVDSEGLDMTDIKLLTTMIEQYNGGPVGVSALAANIGEETETLESMYEPYLMQIGYLQRTPRGRVVTADAYAHLGFVFPQD